MWKKFAVKVAVPTLFASAGVISSIAVADLASHQKEKTSKEISEGPYAPYLISQYDQVFQSVGEKYGIDWLFLAAIARAESEFRFDAISKVGAVGLMQIMPRVANNMGYTRESLFDAQINVEVAARLLIENNNMLHLPEDFDKNQRLRFILACYNAGYSRVADARRLALHHEDDHNDWQTVATYLELLSEPEFIEHEVVQSGLFSGSKETITYVKKVMHIYRRYRSRIML